MNIIQSVELKSGVSKKTGKPWTGFEVTLEDGRKASGFDQVRVGDEVEIEQNGRFFNYKKPNGAQKPTTPPQESRYTAPNKEDGIEATRKHLMRAANLYNLCIDATDKAIAGHFPEVARTSEQFQSTLASLWIEASSRRTTDGVKWWSYLDLMPTTPIKK